jgi:alanine racemase
LPVHLYLDTGMSRGGLSAGQLKRVLHEMAELRHVTLAGIYTHFCSAECDDALTDEQMARFDREIAATGVKLAPGTIFHLANTSATWRSAKYHRDMVRIGLGLYGYGDQEPAEGMKRSAGSTPPPGRLEPIVRWLSRITHVQEYASGTTVGYNATHRLRRESLLGLVPAGYADGYDRALGDLAMVGLPECSVNGKPVYVPVVGRVNMDQIVIDLTDAPAGCGSLVELISADPASPCALPRLAEQAETNTYELLCRLSSRLPRHYIS